jgi:alkanesulfonate monooxygenase SsuD/methylene tetrahydromethanopterin reductase-like flavin-dependent oxidoreductase (luciferase family)
MPVLLGLKPLSEVAEYIALYRRIRAQRGRSPAEIDAEVAAIRVMRRVCLGETDAEAVDQTSRALRWEQEIARSVHGLGPNPTPTLADGSRSGGEPVIPGSCVGTPTTVLAGLKELHALGIRHVIAWMNFGDLPYTRVRASMELLRQDVLPKLADLELEGADVLAGQ